MSNSFEKEMIEEQARAIAPSIFIGLGGVGCKIVNRLANLAAKEIEDGEKSISFVAMDTDVNDLRKIKADNKNIVTIQTSSRKTIGEYLEVDENARNNWFPLNDILLKKTPTEGAGQIRAISNLVGHNATREGELGELDRAIDSLFALSTDEMQQSARVTIIGSVTGGTGSGLILPIALYVRNYLEQVRQQKSCVFRGFFFLPDAMFEVIENDNERDNLRSNAYASVREIDAFMRWSYDKQLRERYPSLRVIMPKVGGGGYTQYNDAPFNFCFLFNQIDSKSESMFSHNGLLDHAANCLYDMTISPISGRVNSQEDNIIREITKNKNSSSYAGAGCSKMIYPYEDIKRYVALSWAKQVISKEWLDADNQVEKKKIEKEQERNNGGIYVKEEDNDIFMNHIRTEANNDNNFYKSIYSQCLFTVEKTGEQIELADLFVADLAAYTEQIRKAGFNATDASDDFEMALEDIKEATKKNTIEHGEQDAQRSNRADLVDSALDNFFKSHDKAINNAKMQIMHIASAIMAMDYSAESKKDVPCLEKYMFITEKEFMHPTAARFFLMSVSKRLTEIIESYKQRFTETDEKYKSSLKELNLQKTADDNDDTPQENFFIAELKKGRKEKFSPSQRANTVNVHLKLLLESGGDRGEGVLDEYCFYLVNIDVFRRINNYIKTIINGYHEFFLNIRGDINSLALQMKQLEKKYENTKGVAKTFICSSEKCFKAIASHNKCSIGAFDLPADLTTAIHNKAKKYARMKKDGSFDEEYGLYENSSETERTNALRDFFGDMFEEIIMEFWINSVVKNCDEKLNMDIIAAVYEEARIEKGIKKDKDQRAYLIKKIRGAENLAAPFIDAPNGEPRDICVFALNDAVEASLNEEEDKLLHSVEFKPISSPEIDKYQIRFYRSIYNIRAKDLNKFACAKNTSNGDSSERFSACGKYSRVYHERIAQIEPLDCDNTEITPHIEKTWQYINVLPELDGDFQHREEVRIAKAFVYALISGKIAYRQHDENGYNFCYEIIDPHVEAPELYVSNGTRCDQFYELLDAFTLCPRYVDRLLELLDRDMQYEKHLGHSFEESEFAKEQAIGAIIDEFSITQKLNIFHIPLLYKASAASNYLIAWGEAMIKAIFELIDDYVNTLEESRYASDVKCRFLSETIYPHYHDNLDALVALKDGDPQSKLKRKHSKLGRIKSDLLTLRVYDLIADVLRKSDSLNPHVGQYSDIIAQIRLARRLLSSDVLMSGDEDNDPKDKK